jgi:hypothetical protein
VYRLCPNLGKCSQRFHPAMPARSDNGHYVNLPAWGRTAATFFISHPLAKPSPQPSSHPCIIHRCYHTAEYAIPQHSSMVPDNDSNSNRSACIQREGAASIVCKIVSYKYNPWGVARGDGLFHFHRNKTVTIHPTITTIQSHCQRGGGRGSMAPLS